MQAQSPQHAASNTAGIKQPWPRGGGSTKQMSVQQGAMPSNLCAVSETALPHSQWTHTAIDPFNQVGGSSFATSVSGGRYGGRGGGRLESLDSKGSEPPSLFHQAPLEKGSATQLRQRMTSALLRREDVGFKQGSRDTTSMPRSLGGNTGLQRSSQSHHKQKGAALFASQQALAVQEALAASVSMAASDGNEHVVEILKSMQGQMVRMRT